jgi:hypothetical protein
MADPPKPWRRRELEATEFFDIVWDDPPTPLCGYGATNPAVSAGNSRAEAPVGAKAGPQAP